MERVRGFVTELNVRCGRKEKDKVHAKVCGLSNQKDKSCIILVGNPLEGQVVGTIKNSVLDLFNLNCR